MPPLCHIRVRYISTCPELSESGLNLAHLPYLDLTFRSNCLIGDGPSHRCPPCRRSNATHVAVFHTWRSVGRFVRKGEKGIAILAPILRRRRESAEEDEPRVIVGFRAAYVFDVEQTDGAPLPEAAKATGDPGEHTAALKR